MEISSEEPFSVSSFLDVLNGSFVGMQVSVRGEVSGVEDRRNVLYFSLKDSEGDSMLSCLIFRNDFLSQGVRVEEGSEVVVDGAPNIWKPRGKLSFRVKRIRLAGEGALKKAYDVLREKLNLEGLFSLERKRQIPCFPRRIALVTSREGAAIGDFSANLGRRGFSVSLFDAHVEGSRALDELVEGIGFFNKNPNQWDVLVLIRGGGSFESLAVYNEEALIRAVSESNIPTVAGIGHEKDVSLVALVADVMVSTPTAAAEALETSWERASGHISDFDRLITDRFQREISLTKGRLDFYADFFRSILETFSLRFRKAERDIDRSVLLFSSWKADAQRNHLELWRGLCRELSLGIENAEKSVKALFARVRVQSPQAILERGYGILRKEGRILRSVSEVGAGDDIETVLSDGIIYSVASSKSLKSTKNAK